MRARSSLPAPERRAELRKAAGLTLQEVADAIGVTRGAVWHWEQGTRAPSGSHLSLYLDALGVFEEAT